MTSLNPEEVPAVHSPARPASSASSHSVDITVSQSTTSDDDMVSVTVTGQENISAHQSPAKSIKHTDSAPPSPIKSIKENGSAPSSPIKIVKRSDSASPSPEHIDVPHIKVELVTPTSSTEVTPERPRLSILSYHVDGDLYIKVRGEEGIALYKVCSPLIAAASPVWRRTVYGGEHPRPDHGKWIIEMIDSDDYVYGLDIIFSIAHYKFHEIPTRPDIDQLYYISKVAEKYQCTHLFIPYMEKWVTGLNWHVVMNGDHNDNDKTLYTTWVLGEGRWFSRVVTKVAHKASVDERGILLDTKGQPWKHQGLPNGIIDLIAKTRLDTLKAFALAVDVPVKKLMDNCREQKTDFCRSKDASGDLKEACQLQQLGSLYSGLTIAGLMPFPDPEEYKDSASNLAKKLLGVKAIRFKLPGVLPHNDTHFDCGIKHKEAVNEIMKKSVQPSGAVIQQLKIRAMKSGAYSDELFKELKGMEERDPSPEPMEDLHDDKTLYKHTDDPASPDYFSGSDESGVPVKLEDLEI
ncbi:hypothetical protein B0T19DRAFT_473232 [Cercophora scortea]|uniref:Nuclear pore protein n=1 Tax=Cercophora scortea TaxID=314031 RepID=A0AAE0IW12_9PEZI|nr:hypothetical protein B0T19DRAFT_473232 [Cercophora scortea]